MSGRPTGMTKAAPFAQLMWLWALPRCTPGVQVGAVVAAPIALPTAVPNLQGILPVQLPF